MEAWKRRMFRARSWLYRKKSKKGPSDPSVLGPTTDPKMGPRAAQNWLPFWTHFWSKFGVAFGSFWVPSGPQDWPGRGLEEPKRAKWSPRGQKDDYQKSGFRIGLSAFFHSWDPPRRPQEAQKTAKERPEGAQKPKKRAPNASLKKNCFWDHFWDHFGDHFGAKIEAKTRPETEPIFETRLL